MTMLDLRLILVLCCSLQLSRLAITPPYPPLCPPEFPHQLDMLACRSINDEFLTFQEAQASCVAKGGKLFEPRTDSEESLMYEILQHTDQGYWVGVTDSDYDGAWTYLSDNTPLTATLLHHMFRVYPPPEGHNCMMSKFSTENGAHFRTAPCEEKARSICQTAIHEKVCGIRDGGELIHFNATYKSQRVTVPCDYTMASIVCGDYDVRVYGTSGRVATSTFSPVSARVVVQRALTQETLVSAQVSRKAIAKSTDGKNLWTVTDGAWSEEVREAFEPARQAAVIKIGDVGQVDFSASKDKVENGLYVRCKDVRSSVEFPETLCEFGAGTTNWTRYITTYPLMDYYFMWAIFLQNAGKQLQCSEIGNKVRSCPTPDEAIRTCFPIFVFRPLGKCFVDYTLWFGRCLDAYCDKNVDRCKMLKTKVSDCGLVYTDRYPPGMYNFLTLLKSC